jgi:hypothetical protein
LLIKEQRNIYRCLILVSPKLYINHGNRWLWRHCISIHPDLTRWRRHSKRKLYRNHGHRWLWRHCLLSVHRPPLTRLWLHSIQTLPRYHGNQRLRWHCLNTVVTSLTNHGNRVLWGHQSISFHTVTVLYEVCAGKYVNHFSKELHLSWVTHQLCWTTNFLTPPVKIQLSVCTPKRHKSECACSSIHWTSVLRGNELLTSLPSRFTAENRTAVNSRPVPVYTYVWRIYHWSW